MDELALACFNSDNSWEGERGCTNWSGPLRELSEPHLSLILKVF